MLQQMAALSGQIFLGHVVGIKFLGNTQNNNISDWPDGSRIVEITFQAEDCVTGCVTNQLVVLHEWASLWRGQPHRYTIGQQAVWMFYPPNAAGISSPVNGILGVLPVRALALSTTSVASPNPASAPETDQQNLQLNVDLRWLQTALLRKNTQLGGTPGGAVHPLLSGVKATTSTVPSLTTQKIQQPMAPLSIVMGVLHAFAATQTSSQR